MRRWILAPLVFAAFGCTTTQTPKNCTERADEAYRMCQQSPFQPVSESESELLNTSDEHQMCRARYQQAMAQCGGGTMKIKTSTISPIPTIEDN